MNQLTDPALICAGAIAHLHLSIESALGMAAFGSASPWRDVGQCEPGVWQAFARASAVASTYAQLGSRKRTLRAAEVWLREHGATIDIDEQLAVREYRPGGYQAIIKDPELAHLGPHIMGNAEAAIADGRYLLSKVAKRKAFEAGDKRFEQVTYQVCGVTYTEVRRIAEVHG
jgi:hypothetical protein